MIKKKYNKYKNIYYYSDKGGDYNFIYQNVFLKLENHGFFAFTEIESLKTSCYSHVPDLLLIDSDNTIDKFLEMLVHFRNPKETDIPYFPVLALISTNNTNHIQQISDSGVDCLLLKPCNFLVIQSRILTLTNNQSNVVESGGKLMPLPRVKYEATQKNMIERELHTWLV